VNLEATGEVIEKKETAPPSMDTNLN